MTVIFIQNSFIYYDNAQFYHASLDSALVTNYTRAERLNDRVVYVSRLGTTNTRKYMIGSDLLIDVVVFHQVYVHIQCNSAKM